MSKTIPSTIERATFWARMWLWPVNDQGCSVLVTRRMRNQRDLTWLLQNRFICALHYQESVNPSAWRSQRWWRFGFWNVSFLTFSRFFTWRSLKRVGTRRCPGCVISRRTVTINFAWCDGTAVTTATPAPLLAVLLLFFLLSLCPTSYFIVQVDVIPPRLFSLLLASFPPGVLFLPRSSSLLSNSLRLLTNEVREGRFLRNRLLWIIPGLGRGGLVSTGVSDRSQRCVRGALDP